eukprot:CAMPEP_0170077260 /NCGR_PEP_ID=MMETSP0019_2-20121128/14113_1 /TAXON_ID=98059 /ORGANISM="Dinobryon sp., Strain UTEXLB2267" /LENGTH=59 /DNA_ID=CAMNT_0010289483 /DNA_START=794 /DNA_END=973 /DNA_ORIENTATION=-
MNWIGISVALFGVLSYSYIEAQSTPAATVQAKPAPSTTTTQPTTTKPSAKKSKSKRKKE